MNPMTFKGWPIEAVEFYEGLQADNSKVYWQEHKAVYERCVRGPMEQLLAELAEEFGAGKLFRPHRDVRFSADKTPYKTNCAATLGTGYVSFSADGLSVGGGLYMPDPAALQRYRDAVDDEKSGSQLAEIVAALRAAAARGEIEMAIPCQLHGLEGADGALEAVILATLKGEEKRVPADHLLAFFGLSMELGPIAEWGLGLEHHHIVVNPATLESNIPGVHAIGDIATYPGKLKLILQGFSEAAMAAHAIHPRVFPGEALHFEYSTSKGVATA